MLISKDDTSIGEPLPGATGLPSYTYASTALSLNQASALILTNFCIRNAVRGIEWLGSGQLTLRHGQFVDCADGVKTAAAVRLQNLLFHNVTDAVYHTANAASTGEYLTVDTASYLNYTTAGATLALTNSLKVTM